MPFVVLRPKNFGEVRVFLQRQNAMRRKAFDRERPCDANDALGLQGAVVQLFDVGIAGDGRVDLLLPLAPKFPPGCMIGLHGVGPREISFARDLPLLPLLLERGIKAGSQFVELGLIAIPDDVDFGVVGDGFERYVRRARRRIRGECRRPTAPRSAASPSASLAPPRRPRNPQGGSSRISRPSAGLAPASARRGLYQW